MEKEIKHKMFILKKNHIFQVSIYSYSLIHRIQVIVSCQVSNDSYDGSWQETGLGWEDNETEIKAKPNNQ